MSLATTVATDPTSLQSRTRAKSTRAKATSSGKPSKVSFYLSDESIKRLGVHATMDGTDKSSIVDQLIRENLRRYDLPRKRTGSPSIDMLEDRQTGSEG